MKNLRLHIRIQKIKVIKTYLREVLGMKSKEFWLRLEWKDVFGWERHEGGKIEVLKKLPLCAPLKTKKSLISRDNYSQSTCKLLMKCLKCTRQVSWEAISRKVLAKESRNSLCTILKEMKIHFLVFATMVQDTLLATDSWKCL